MARKPRRAMTAEEMAELFDDLDRYFGEGRYAPTEETATQVGDDADDSIPF